MDDLSMPDVDAATPSVRTGSQVRVGTAERERAAAALGEHWSAGRLEFHEYEERVSRAYEARTVGDITQLLADLPAVGQIEQNRKPAPVARQGRRICWPVLAPYVGVNVMMVMIWALSGAGYFWPVWVMGPWGLAILPAVLGGRHGRARHLGQADRTEHHGRSGRAEQRGRSGNCHQRRQQT